MLTWLVSFALASPDAAAPQAAAPEASGEQPRAPDPPLQAEPLQPKSLQAEPLQTEPPQTEPPPGPLQTEPPQTGPLQPEPQPAPLPDAARPGTGDPLPGSGVLTATPHPTALPDGPPAPEPADDPPAPVLPRHPTLELVGIRRHSSDLEVFIRYDGNIYVQDQIVFASDLEARLAPLLEATGGGRVVISADASAPYEVLMTVVRTAQALDAPRVALEVMELIEAPPDPLFPGEGAELSALDVLSESPAPRRATLPQDPYSNNSSYTAYALEWGEAKLGVGSIQAGIAPRIQLGTAPMLDLIGALNLTAKANVLREGPLDGALLLQYYNLPLGGLIGAFTGDWITDQSPTASARASYLGLGATGSLQLRAPWSIHAQLYLMHPSTRGDVAFDSLPPLLLPGLSLGGTGAVGVGVIGDVGVLNVATDYRFNRRDSVFLWLRYPFYGRVRGLTSGAIDGFEQLENASFIVAYGDTIPFVDSYSVALGYQASYRHLELRAGLGLSALPGVWALQAFELSYRFGGATRRRERRIRRGHAALQPEHRT